MAAIVSQLSPTAVLERGQLRETEGCSASVAVFFNGLRRESTTALPSRSNRIVRRHSRYSVARAAESSDSSDQSAAPLATVTQSSTPDLSSATAALNRLKSNLATFTQSTSTPDVSSAVAAAQPYAPSVLGAGALGVASYLIVRKLTSGSAKAEEGAEAKAAPPSGIVPRAKKAAKTALAAMAATFPRAMQEEAFMKAVSQELSKLGFKRDNCIALVSTCRDEVCRPVVSLVDREFGLSFNIAGLGGVLNCGSTGFKAAMSHSPEFRCETDGTVKERYIFFAFPHVSIGESGEVGSLLRRGRGKPSSACGALIAIQNDINAGKATVADPYDEEYVLLKKKVKSLILRRGGSEYSLVEVTRAALAAINDDLEKLISLTVDPAAADYAVITGVQIHSGDQIPGEPFCIERTCDYIAPDMMYAVVRGQRYDLQLEANKEDLAVHSKDESIEQYEARLEARRQQLQASGAAVKSNPVSSTGSMADAFEITPRTAIGITSIISIIALVAPFFMSAWNPAASPHMKGLTYLTLLLGFYMAWNIGANDVANAMGTSVGSGALTLRQAVLAAAILEFGGAFLVGSHVSHTMQNGIIKANVFAGKNAMLFTGMISSLAAAGTWLQVASYFGWPVSTTHCIIGAMVGFGIIFGGWNAVYWSSLARVVSSWVVSPLLGASIAFIVYKCIRKFVYSSSNPGQSASTAAPILVFAGVSAFSFFSLFTSPGVLLRACALSLAAGAASAVAMNAVIKRQMGALLGEFCEIPKPEEPKPEKGRGPMGTQLRIVYGVFGYLQVLSACFMSFAHGANDEANHPCIQQPNFEEALQAHFLRLPTRYALDVNTERAEDVLTHKRLLEEAAKMPSQPVVHVRAVRVGLEEVQESLSTLGKGNVVTAALPGAAGGDGAAGGGTMETDEAAAEFKRQGSLAQVPMHEVTFSTVDRPKLLSQLSAVLADVGLNICEAHVFSTSDGLSLDVFVVDGWPSEDVVEMRAALMRAAQQSGENGAQSTLPEASGQSNPAMSESTGVPVSTSAATGAAGHVAASSLSGADSRVRIPSDGRDDWEIDNDQLKLQHKIASGSFGDLYRGTYCGQDVAIKILKAERLNDTLQQEFAQEVFIMRKVRHKNVVQFIGACTKPPNLSIVTEFMVGGSVYDYLHKHRGSMKLPMVLRVGMDVAKGMDFLHKNNIIHRDLKAANLLMDENDVVKVADFGVARVKANSGVMTAETGTYRWMAPEVIEHRAYDHKADIFSFGITMWEMLTGKLPYPDLTPLQAAVSVVQRGLRPPIPKGTHPRLADLFERCWATNPVDRPEFSEIIRVIAEIAQELEEDGEADQQRREKRGGFFASFKRAGSGPR
ncbi:unnamed protein product [Closterium sp. Yama58-4]|nr:unnamed protein product [Closterium sp. Yama58-4]